MTSNLIKRVKDTISRMRNEYKMNVQHPRWQAYCTLGYCRRLATRKRKSKIQKNKIIGVYVHSSYDGTKYFT